LALGYDTMHGLDLGVFPYIVELMDPYLTDKYGVQRAKRALKEMNRCAVTA